MRYDPDIAPSAPLWLSLEEARRIALVEEYHDATALPNARVHAAIHTCLLYTSPSPRDGLLSRMPSSA